MKNDFSPAISTLWAKTSNTSSGFHPLIFHMLDTAAVFTQLWHHSFAPAIQRKFQNWLQLDAASTPQVLTFLAALHDIGKASPAFQQKYPACIPVLASIGLNFPNPAHYTAMMHGTVSAMALPQLLAMVGVSRCDSNALASALGGHHGVFPLDLELNSIHRTTNLGGSAWDAARQELFYTLYALLNPSSAPIVLPTDDAERNAFLMLFSGAVTNSDWLASMENVFVHTPWQGEPASYYQSVLQVAETSLHTIGFRGWTPPDATLNFEPTFGFPPNPVQQELLEQAAASPLPAMLIVEAPTGCGKTEAALALADHWMCSGAAGGLYVAMPTTATSNQMFKRVGTDFLQKRYPAELINVQLAHGSAMLNSDLNEIILQSVGEEEEEGLIAMGWFLPKKRTLLAPFAVGTVDQALLSVLLTKHFFVRLFGLGGKVIIFDEVHAYDAYMSEIFCRLLQWLRAAQVSVILLSATLSEDARRRFARAYGADLSDSDNGDLYPRFTLVNPSGCRTGALSYHSSRELHLEWCQPEPQDIVNTLRARLADGGCAAVVCNTVRRAQEIYKTVAAAGLCPPENCILFHARFPFQRRQELETLVTERFGKANANRKRAIVIATQVIEQSLDLDFDFMISDLAPVDLLLQRAGRLHRHNRPTRPAGLEQPTLAICQPEGEDHDAPDFGGSRYVYEPYILLRTLAVLRDRKSISLPADTVELIESIYGGRNEALMTALAEPMQPALQKMHKNNKEAQIAARSVMLLPPTDSGVISMPNPKLEDENPAVHRDMQALTRLGSVSLQLVCLHRMADGSLNTRCAGNGETIDLHDRSLKEKARALLKASLSIQHHDVVNYLLGAADAQPAALKKISALRHHRLVVFENGCCPLPGSGVTLFLSTTFGLSVEKEVQ